MKQNICKVLSWMDGEMYIYIYICMFMGYGPVLIKKS